MIAVILLSEAFGRKHPQTSCVKSFGCLEGLALLSQSGAILLKPENTNNNTLRRSLTTKNIPRDPPETTGPVNTTGRKPGDLGLK